MTYFLLSSLQKTDSSKKRSSWNFLEPHSTILSINVRSKNPLCRIQSLTFNADGSNTYFKPPQTPKKKQCLHTSGISTKYSYKENKLKDK